MRKFDIVKNYLHFVPDFDIYKCCPSYFGLEDMNDCGKYINREDICKTCWEQESNKNELSVLWELYNLNNRQIKELHKKERLILDSIQELCPHKNVDTYNDDTYMPWNPEYDEDRIVKKCKDCGKILS